MGRFQADALQYINASIEADENYCLPLIVKAIMLAGANDARFCEEIWQVLHKSENMLPMDNGFESGLVEAVRLSSKGCGVEAATQYDRMLRNSPDNLFLHVLAQEQTFWLGGCVVSQSVRHQPGAKHIKIIFQQYVYSSSSSDTFA